MPIAKGAPYGAPGPLPPGAVIVRSDAEAREVLEAARRGHRPRPVLGLVGGDLCRTLGGGGEGGEARLRTGGGVVFPVDLGEVLADGRLHLFVAHLVARTRLWNRSFVAMNAQWLGPWNLGPRAHPGDGLVDTYDARLSLGQLPVVRSRLHHGAHLPHPGITERRAPSVQVELERALPLRLDGRVVGRARTLAVRVEPDALTVVV
ncbi:MAG: hypothetical protein ABR511_08270 [Acidimicrobiales bacterium]